VGSKGSASGLNILIQAISVQSGNLIMMIDHRFTGPDLIFSNITPQFTSGISIRLMIGCGYNQTHEPAFPWIPGLDQLLKLILIKIKEFCYYFSRRK